MSSKIDSLLAPLFAFALIYAAPALAETVKVTPASGHPTAVITVSGTAFGDLEAIDVYVDTVDTLLLVSSATGTFSGSVTIPVTASPGTHYITAIGRHSGDAAQKAFTVTTPWVEDGFGAAGLRWNPYENMLNTLNVPTLGPMWQATTGTAESSPAVVSGRVYVATYFGQGVESLNASTGAVIWSTLSSVQFYASPAVVGGVVYVGAFNPANGMYALNAVTGATIWNHVLSTSSIFVSSPVVIGGVVYVGCNDGNVYAFQATTGNLLWTYATDGDVESSPAVVSGVIYIGSNDSNVYALNATTGALIWKYTTGGVVTGSPAVANGVVYVGSQDYKVYAIRANGGSLLWSFTTGAAIDSSPAVEGGTVYIGSIDGNIYALNAHSGAVRWSMATGSNVYGSPAVANGVVYVGSAIGSLFGLDATDGNVLWTAETGNDIESTPVVSDGVVYVNNDGISTSAFAAGAGTNAVVQNLRAPAISSLHPDMSLTVTR